MDNIPAAPSIWDRIRITLFHVTWIDDDIIENDNKYNIKWINRRYVFMHK